MATNRKRIARKMVIHGEPLTECLLYYFIHGKLADLPGKADTFRLLRSSRRAELQKLWIKHRGNIIAKNKDCWAEENLI